MTALALLLAACRPSGERDDEQQPLPVPQLPGSTPDRAEARGQDDQARLADLERRFDRIKAVTRTANNEELNKRTQGIDFNLALLKSWLEELPNATPDEKALLHSQISAVLEETSGLIDAAQSVADRVEKERAGESPLDG